MLKGEDFALYDKPVFFGGYINPAVYGFRIMVTFDERLIPEDKRYLVSFVTDPPLYAFVSKIHGLDYYMGAYTPELFNALHRMVSWLSHPDKPNTNYRKKYYRLEVPRLPVLVNPAHLKHVPSKVVYAFTRSVYAEIKKAHPVLKEYLYGHSERFVDEYTDKSIAWVDVLAGTNFSDVVLFAVSHHPCFLDSRNNTLASCYVDYPIALLDEKRNIKNRRLWKQKQ